ncbi:MAG TPA: CocE/NonD family hydrolase [Roseimicrobium sp.]|nr:CocE/NonD family hydrolase [Roseimicrobium sp.]
MFQRRTFAALALFVVSMAGSFAAPLPPLDLAGIREEHIMIPMRDGVKLSAYVYFPPGAGPWPVIFEQRYAVITNAASRKELAKLAAAGYVTARASFRGSQLSEGQWEGYRNLAWGERKDGYDLVEWFAKQSWSNGKVGTFGGSQGGFAQNFLAVTRPPHLVCQYMTDTGLSLFQEGYRIGGATRPERFMRMSDVCRDPVDQFILMGEWFKHPTYDGYWAAEDCTRHFSKMNVPCFTVGSWYDYMSVGSIQSFIGRQHHGGSKSTGNQQLLIGPWLHGGYPKSNKIGDLVYPEDAMFDVHAHMIRWFDHHLKGVKNGIDQDPTVRYYVMGAVGETNAPGNEWRAAKDWPVKSTETSYFLQAGDVLSLDKPEVPVGFSMLLSDPRKPASLPYAAFPGARDARAFEKQPGVLIFDTKPLEKPVEWTGLVKAEIYLSSTAPDTDVIVRVCDVYPDGRSILIMDYVRRARYREGWDKEVFLKPGEPVKIAFDVGSLSQIFNTGHRIRITVASTGAPFYEPNPQTDGPLGILFPDNAIPATNTIYHQSDRASRILAPVVAAKR